MPWILSGLGALLAWGFGKGGAVSLIGFIKISAYLVACLLFLEQMAKYFFDWQNQWIRDLVIWLAVQIFNLIAYGILIPLFTEILSAILSIFSSFFGLSFDIDYSADLVYPLLYHGNLWFPVAECFTMFSLYVAYKAIYWTTRFIVSASARMMPV